MSEFQEAPGVVVVAKKDQESIQAAVANLLTAGRRPVRCSGGLALILAGARSNRTALEVVGLSIATPSLSELALRTCVSVPGGCSESTCGSAVLRFDKTDLLMVGKGTLEEPMALRNALTSASRGVLRERLVSAHDSGRGFSAAHQVHATGHGIGDVGVGYFADAPTMHTLKEAVDSLWVTVPRSEMQQPVQLAA